MRYLSLVNGMLTASLLFLTAGCGGDKSSGGGDGPKPPVQKDGDAEKDGLLIDTSYLSNADASVRTNSGKIPVWDFRLMVNGEEKAAIQGGNVEQVIDAVKPLEFNKGQILRIEVTLKDQEDLKVLATNVEEIARQDETHSAFWDRECMGISPEFSLLKDDLSWYDDTNEFYGIKVKVCDFAAIFRPATVAISPHKPYDKPHTVSYACSVGMYTNGASSSMPLADSSRMPSACEYGYFAFGDRAAPGKLSYPKKYAPAPGHQKLAFQNFNLEYTSSTGEYDLAIRVGSIPFGTISACHRIEMEVQYKQDGQTTRGVFEFIRVRNGNDVRWIEDSEAAQQLPDRAAIADAYPNSSGEPQKVRFNILCQWFPEAEDQAVTIQPQG